MTITIERQFPTFAVLVDGEVRFSGLWRRSSAEALAASLLHPAKSRRSHKVRVFFAHVALTAALLLAQMERHSHEVNAPQRLRSSEVATSC